MLQNSMASLARPTDTLPLPVEKKLPNYNDMTQTGNVTNLHLLRQQQLRGAFNASGGRFVHGITSPAAIAMFQQAAVKSGLKTFNPTSFCRQPTPPSMSGHLTSSVNLPMASTTHPSKILDAFGALKESGKPSISASSYAHQPPLVPDSPSPALAVPDGGSECSSSTVSLDVRPPLPRQNNASEIFQRNRSSSFGIY